MRALLALIACAAAAPVHAQTYIGAELTTNRYGGSARDSTGAHGHPGGGGAISLRVGHTWSKWGVALRMSYANAGFTVGNGGVSITDKTTGRLFEVSPLVSAKVGGIGPSGAVRMEVGSALHLWDFDGDYRKRIGAVAAAAYDWTVTRRFTGSVRFEGMLSPSWFDAADVPPEFGRHATWRYGVGLGLRYRLSGG